MTNSPRFRRDALRFREHLSSLLTRTIAPDHPLACRFYPGGDRAQLELRDGVAPAGDGLMRVSQLIGPSRQPGRTVRTLKYSYLYAVGPDPDTDWLVRYDYEPYQAEIDPSYRYPIAHVHFNGSSPAYAAYASARVQGRPLERLHFPTRRISLEEFVELLIVEFGAETPGRTAEEALDFLAESLEGFQRGQTGTGVRARGPRRSPT